MVSDPFAWIAADYRPWGHAGRVSLIVSSTEPRINKIVMRLVAFAVLWVQPRPYDVMFPIVALGENRKLKDFLQAIP
jgi:hypothetical protein